MTQFRALHFSSLLVPVLELLSLSRGPDTPTPMKSGGFLVVYSAHPSIYLKGFCEPRREQTCFLSLSLYCIKTDLPIDQMISIFPNQLSPSPSVFLILWSFLGPPHPPLSLEERLCEDASRISKTSRSTWLVSCLASLSGWLILETGPVPSGDLTWLLAALFYESLFSRHLECPWTLVSCPLYSYRQL